MATNAVRQTRIPPDLIFVYAKFSLIEGWSLYKHKRSPDYHIVFHDECFDHWAIKWPRAGIVSSNINKHTISCPYCKLKSSREVMKRIKFILGIV